MAEQSFSSNPFLGNQASAAPEKQAVPTGETQAPGTVSAVSKLVSSSDGEQATGANPLVRQGLWQNRSMRRGVVGGVLALAIAGVLYWWFRGVEPAPVSEAPLPKSEGVIPSAIVPEPLGLALPADNANYESENFKAGEIVIGGELQFLVDEGEVGPLTVENIRGEAFVEKNKKEVKLVVTWTTSKLSQGSVRYSKGIGQAERSILEDDYSYNHSVIISGLDPASTYLYTIDAFDRYGNEARSDPHAVFTGARTVSLFDLIAGAIGEVFGWAVSDN